MTTGFHPSIHAASAPDSAACISATTGAVTTYAELDARSNQIAHWFRRNGIETGDSIVLLAENSPAFYEVVWAAQRAGLYYTPISWHSTAEEIAYIVTNAAAKVFFASALFAAPARQALAAVPDSVRGLSLNGAIDGFELCADVIAAEPTTPIEDQASGREMLYTSGTTGEPKGVKFALSGQPIDAAGPGDMFYQHEGYGPDAVVLAPGPAYHASPLLVTMAAHRFGASVLIVEKFDAEELLKLIARYGVSHMACVPAHFVRLLKLPADVRARYDVSSIQWIVHTAAPCPVDIKQAMIDWFGPIIVEIYSGTERVGGSIIRSDEWMQHPGSIGRSPDGSAHVVDEATWQECASGDTGVIYFDSPESFSYHGDTKKTESVRSPQGWMTLGDIGHIDADGYIYLTDRKSNVIITGGVNVYPQESENRLVTHASVADAAVFGIPNESFGEEVKAVVQVVPGVDAGSALEAELIDFCKAVLSPLKCPRSIDFLDQLPREANGKLYKQKLIDRYRQ